MSRCTDNQDVGLEAATIKRVRNSSLVECCGADNDRGSSLQPKPWMAHREMGRGRGAFCPPVNRNRGAAWTGKKSKCRPKKRERREKRVPRKFRVSSPP